MLFYDMLCYRCFKAVLPAFHLSRSSDVKSDIMKSSDNYVFICVICSNGGHFLYGEATCICPSPCRNLGAVKQYTAHSKCC